MKYRILIVDDEKIVLESLEYMINNSAFELSVATARNGREALTKLDDFRPHIILTDIRMPSIDGVDLVKMIRKNNTKIKIIFISAYEQFEYAKISMKYGVSDYILKPITKQKLNDTISKVIKTLEDESYQTEYELRIVEKFNVSKEIIADHFLTNKSSDRLPLKVYEDILEYKFLKGMLIKVNMTFSSKYDSQEFDSERQAKKLYKKLSVIFSDYKCINSIPEKSMYMMYISGIDNFENTHNKINKLIKEQDDSDHIRIVIQGVKISDLEQLQEFIYRQEEWSNEEMDFMYSNIQTNELDIQELYGIAREFLLPNSLKLTQTLEILINKIKKMTMVERELIASEGIDKILNILNFHINDQSNVLSLVKFDDSNLDIFYEKLTTAFFKYHNLYQRDYSKLVNKALKYIDKNKKLSFSLDDVAKELFVTSQYLSKIFKDETGFNFKEYVVDVKISLAKELLKGGYSISEASDDIGYSEVNYFIKSFKKHTGITPGEYQRVNKNENK